MNRTLGPPVLVISESPVQSSLYSRASRTPVLKTPSVLSAHFGLPKVLRCPSPHVLDKRLRGRSLHTYNSIETFTSVTPPTPPLLLSSCIPGVRLLVDSLSTPDRPVAPTRESLLTRPKRRLFAVLDPLPSSLGSPSSESGTSVLPRSLLG